MSKILVVDDETRIREVVIIKRKNQQSEQWSTCDKFLIAVETSTLSERR